MDKKTLIKLLDKQAAGSLSSEEKQQLLSYLDTDEGQQILAEVWDMDFEALPLDEDLQAQENIFRRIEVDERFIAASPNSTVRAFSSRWLQVAALVAVLLSVAAYYFYVLPTATDHSAYQSQLDHIFPGSDRARIVFDDGTVVDLADIQYDTLLVDKGITLYKDATGAVGYKIDRPENQQTVLYTTIITPKGGEHQIVLPDGSQVWLNAASTLRYPLAFASETREIMLEGEAYFEVKPLRKEGRSLPFIVHTSDQRLEVLGTSFNINSYGDYVKTTLVEGAVSLQYPHTADAERLFPNQQAIYNPRKESFLITQVDPYFAIAWRQGSFAFDNASIYTVMEDIARWYDIEVEYVGDLSALRYSGTISRFENFKQLLQIIEWTDLVTFSVEGRRVRVMK